jgi:hypothetical protein
MNKPLLQVPFTSTVNNQLPAGVNPAINIVKVCRHDQQKESSPASDWGQ